MGSMNELRRDYFLDRWVIISTERAKRPNDFIKPKAPAAEEPCKGHQGEMKTVNGCSFCPGSELKTPPSKASYFMNSQHLHCEADVEGEPRGGWIMRVIPNLYPAVEPGEPRAISGTAVSETAVSETAVSETAVSETAVSETAVSASGLHEVIVESPVHDRHPQFMSDEEIKLLFMVYRDRFKAIAEAPHVKYISLFRNYGKEAGASLSHAHSQIVSLPIVPSVIREQFGLDYGKVVSSEAQGPRLILESEHTVAFAPFASCYTYETWIFPKRPCKNILELKEEERDDFATMARDVLARMSRLLADPPYNYTFVQSLTDNLHMNLRIYPKLGVEAGFELNTRVHINSVPPESAAKSLREVRL